MKSYRFIRAYAVQDVEARIFQKDEVVELSETSARHFARKNLIKEVRATAKKKPRKRAPAKKAAAKK